MKPCGLTDGFSGGPWFLDEDDASAVGRGPVVSVNSFGGKNQGGPWLDQGAENLIKWINDDPNFSIGQPYSGPTTVTKSAAV